MNAYPRNYTRPPSILETERLLLRAPRLEDALDLAELAAADPSFASLTVGDEDNSLESACTAIVRMIDDRRNGIGAWWIVVEKATDRAIGLFGYSDRNPGAGLVSAIAASCIGKGFLVESIDALAKLGPILTYSSSDSESESMPKQEARGSSARWYWRSKSAHTRAELRQRCA